MLRSAAPGLGQFARTRLHLVEQPHVLDRDDRLVRECRSQLDLRSLNGRTALRCRTITPIGIPSRSSGTPSKVRRPTAVGAAKVYSGSASTSGT